MISSSINNGLKNVLNVKDEEWDCFLKSINNKNEHIAQNVIHRIDSYKNIFLQEFGKIAISIN